MDAISEPILQMRRWIEDCLWAVRNCFTFRFIHYDDNIDRLAFFEEINCGWYQMYIYPYDDLYVPIISEERKLRLDQHPITFYVTEQDYDAIINAIDNPQPISPQLKQLLEKQPPWETNDKH
jgi:hypothetical protein